MKRVFTFKATQLRENRTVMLGAEGVNVQVIAGTLGEAYTSVESLMRDGWQQLDYPQYALELVSISSPIQETTRWVEVTP